MTDPKHRQYTHEEAASILTRVLNRQSGEGGRISHDELLETARDIGVTTLELEEEVVAEVKLRAARLVREEQRQRALRQLLRHVAVYVVLGAFCFVIDVRVTNGVWYFWVLLVWGVVVALHAVTVLLPTDVDRRLAAPAAPNARNGPDGSADSGAGKLELKLPPPGS